MTGAEQLLHAMNALRRDVLSIPRTALERVETGVYVIEKTVSFRRV